MCFSNTLYVIVFFSFTGLLLVPYGLIYSACTVCIAHCLSVSHVSHCEKLNDDDDDDEVLQISRCEK